MGLIDVKRYVRADLCVSQNSQRNIDIIGGSELIVHQIFTKFFGGYVFEIYIFQWWIIGNLYSCDIIRNHFVSNYILYPFISFRLYIFIFAYIAI